VSSSINWSCVCRSGGAIKARIREDDEEEAKVWNETVYARLKKAFCFDLNAQFVLGMQHMGCSEKDASILAPGMLDLAVSPMQTAWSRIEQEIGVNETKIEKQIVEDNAKLEAGITGSKPFTQHLDGPPMPFKYPITNKMYTEKLGRCQQCWKWPK
jgi:hypothetical protein